MQPHSFSSPNLPDPPPWIDSEARFERTLLGAEGAADGVLLNRGRFLGQASAPSLSLGAALRLALADETTSLNAVVGFFHHGSDGDLSATGPSDDPAHIILEEAEAERRRFASAVSPSERPGFRLLAGQLNSRPAQLAARAWYLLCRWHDAPATRGEAAQLRAAFLARAAETRFVQAAHELFEGRLRPAGPFASRDSKHLLAWLQTLPEPSGGPDAPEDLRALADALSQDLRDAATRRSAAVLLGFFLQRAGDLRMDAPPGEGPGIFHPKIYVVERGDAAVDAPHRTVAFVGSNNWSRAAFGGPLGEPSANVEVSTVHAAPGHLWSGPSPAAQALTARVVATARHLFASAPVLLGRWDSTTLTDDERRRWAGAKRLLEVTAWREDPLAGDGDWPEDAQERSERASATARALAPHLRRMVRRLLGLPDGEPFAAYVDAFKRANHAADATGLLGGQTPASYQVDGLLRLLAIFTSPDAPGRGAFLTDEPGLGKTLVGQMTAAVLLARRLAQAHDEPRTLPDDQLRASLVVPARLTGRKKEGGAEATRWHLRAQEIREAVGYLLRQVEGIPSDAVQQLLGKLELRVLSHGAFTPGELQDAEHDELASVPWGASSSAPSPQFLDDFFFLAASEVVVLDESHNFRNQDARGTRTLRLLLSLPVPGERWPLYAVDPQGAGQGRDVTAQDGASLAPHLAPRRRVLNLSATPFNNTLDDLLTQIGHFAQYQDWNAPYEKLARQVANAGPHLDGASPAQPFERLNEALAAWWRPATSPAERSEAFKTLLAFARRHLHSGRRLSIPPDQSEDRAQRDADERTRYDDLGPEYRWAAGGEDGAPGYGAVEGAFAHVLRLAREQKKREEATPDSLDLRDETAPPTGSVEEDEVAVAEATPEEEQARRELETQLTRLFVQRSRVRALRILDAQRALGAPVGASAPVPMFRSPHVPRHPLALNPGQNASGGQPSPSAAPQAQTSFEARVLGSLYESLFNPQADGALTFFCYELSIRRSRGDNETTRRNALGFQKVLLLKRLQSSPYAFLRTLVRGVLRQSLAELALVERALADDTLGPKLADHAQAAGLVDGALKRGLDALAQGLLNILQGDLGALLRHTGAHRPTPTDHRHRRVFRAASGWWKPQDRDAEHKRKLDRAFDELRHAAEAPPSAGWLRDLLGDVAAGVSGRLWTDVRRVTSWLGDEVIPTLYAGLPKPLRGARLDDLITKAQALAGGAGSQDVALSSQSLRAWLLGRLQDDRRARSLLGWLMLQAAAREDLRADPARSRARLPGGWRSLVFTEYGDTLTYLRALLAALDAALTPADGGPPPGAAPLLAALRGAVSDVGQALVAEAHAVRRAPRARNAYTDPSIFAPPLDSAWLDGWLDRTDPAGGPAAPARVWRSVRAMLGHTAYASGDGDGFIAAAQATAGSPSDRAVPVVDAFSPWYQIEPRLSPHAGPAGAAAAQDYLGRLSQAARRPVRALLATDILAEGVNLQECGVVVHYDLPWNPTRLIQRNGRVDRRLNPAYEDEESRRLLARGLRAAAGRAVASDEALPFEPLPGQIYHLTVVPVEPTLGGDDDEQTRLDRVRAALGTKLEDIRALFGLTSWPVVLDLPSARRVLTGELDFETPGFRRREELFAALARLSAISSTPPDAGLSDAGLSDAALPAHPGSLVLRLHVPRRQRRADRANLPFLPPSLSAPPPDLAATGAVFWTHEASPSHGRPGASRLGGLGRNVRAASDASGSTAAITGTLVAHGGREAAPRGLVWRRGGAGSRGEISPAWIDLAGEVDASHKLHLAFRDAPLGRLMPTELADEVVLVVVDALLAPEGAASCEIIPTDEPVPLELLGLSLSGRLRDLAQGPLFGAVHRPVQSIWGAWNHQAGAVVKPFARSEDRPAPLASNLWVVLR